ncbi:MAG TPA: sulfite exporter TauE/SafE family protein [Symbiobacteriaceae bacterium]|jgi:hypothetical protein
MSPGLWLLGFAAGILSGMAAGGSAVLVPGLVLLFGIAQHKAQGAVLTALLATQTAAAIGQCRAGNTKGKLAWWLIAGATVGGLAGAWLALRTQPALLRKIYAWYLLILGAAGWLTTPKTEVPVRNRR